MLPDIKTALYALNQIAAPSNKAKANHEAEVLIYEAICALEGWEHEIEDRKTAKLRRMRKALHDAQDRIGYERPLATDSPIDMDDPDIQAAMMPDDRLFRDPYNEPGVVRGCKSPISSGRDDPNYWKLRIDGRGDSCPDDKGKNA